MFHFVKVVIIALSMLFIGCQTTENKRHEELRRQGPLLERTGTQTRSHKALIVEICLDSRHKALCHRTMEVALTQCHTLVQARIDHARCILGSIQEQLRGSNVKYLLLGGRE